MNTTTTTTTTLPTRATSLDVEELRALIAGRSWRLESSWFWEGRARFGLLNVIDGNECVYAVPYRRVTQSWNDGDRQLIKVRSGSPRHLAILDVLAEIKRVYS